MTMPRPITNEKGRTVATLFIPTKAEKKQMQNADQLSKDVAQVAILKRELQEALAQLKK